MFLSPESALSPMLDFSYAYSLMVEFHPYSSDEDQQMKFPNESIYSAKIPCFTGFTIELASCYRIRFDESSAYYLQRPGF